MADDAQDAPAPAATSSEPQPVSSPRWTALSLLEFSFPLQYTPRLRPHAIWSREYHSGVLLRFNVPHSQCICITTWVVPAPLVCDA